LSWGYSISLSEVAYSTYTYLITNNSVWNTFRRNMAWCHTFINRLQPGLIWHFYNILKHAIRGPHLIRGKCPCKWIKGKLHKNQWYMNYWATFFVWKIQINHGNKLVFSHEERCKVVHLPLILLKSTILPFPRKFARN